MSGLLLLAGHVPAGQRHDLVTVDGRSFAISGEGGDMAAPTHGLVYDDVRHLSRLRMRMTGGRVELLAASTPTPLSALVVSRVTRTVDASVASRGDGRLDEVAEVLLVRRRWLAGSLVEELTMRNSHAEPVTVHLELEVEADFAHGFDVKSGTGSADTARPEASSLGHWTLRSPRDPEDSTEVVMEPAPDESDPSVGPAAWRLRIGGGDEVTVTVTVQPVSAGVPADLDRPSRLAKRGGDPGPGGPAQDGPDGRLPRPAAAPPRSTRRWPTWPPYASSTGSTLYARSWPPVRRGS